MHTALEFNQANRLSFDPWISKPSAIDMLKIRNQKFKLGALLVQKGIVSSDQLKTALSYQHENQIKLGEALVSLNFVTPSTIKRALIKQSWLKTIAAIGTFMLAPIVSTSCFSLDNQKASTIKVASIESPRVPFKNNLQASFTPRTIDKHAKDYYFSSHETKTNGDNVFFVVGRKLSETSGVSISLFSKPAKPVFLNEWQEKNINSNDLAREESHFMHFDPQISLFKYTVKPNTLFNQRKIHRKDRYTNTIPAVIMLSLKGRSIYESAGSQTKVWSLDRAKKGVQRKAQLMLSITKQF